MSKAIYKWLCKIKTNKLEYEIVGFFFFTHKTPDLFTFLLEVEMIIAYYR